MLFIALFCALMPCYINGQIGLQTVTYSAGSFGSFVVPGNVGQLELECVGGSGGDSTQINYDGGRGGRVRGILNVSDGDIIYIRSGGAGGSGVDVAGVGGINGGGAACCSRATSGGGGASDVRWAADTLEARILVAGGGGGGRRQESAVGGAGGWPNGTAGLDGFKGSNEKVYGSLPGNQTLGGFGGALFNNYPVKSGVQVGTFGQGGTGCASGHGGGGGGGYFGGGAGCDGASGGGGSSYYDPTKIHNFLHETAYNDLFADGYVVLTYYLGKQFYYNARVFFNRNRFKSYS